MKISTLVLLFSLISSVTFGEITSLESLDLNTDRVAVHFENHDKDVVLVFSDSLGGELHTVIDVHRIKDLAYKTRVMRYFGGLLVNETYHFRKLIVVVDGERYAYPWSRNNVSSVVNKMVHHAEVAR